MMTTTPLPKISVITPSLNQGRFLRQCIESVLSQNYSNLEFIIIDAESKDETLSVIKEFENKIDYWVSEPDSGQSNGINKGFKRATGEIVTWLNADDYYLSGALGKIAEAYRSDPLAPFYFGDGLRVNELGEFISNFFPANRLLFDRAALVMGLNYILQPSTFINRQSLEQIGYLDEGLHYGMDSDLWMKLSVLGTPRPLNATLAATREYATTKTASGSFARVEELRQISMKHSGFQITPGVLCYQLDTLHRFVQQNEDTFPSHYLNDIVTFWSKTNNLLASFNAGPDGFPMTRAPDVPSTQLPEQSTDALQQIHTLTTWVHEARAEATQLREQNTDALQQIHTLTTLMNEGRAEKNQLLTRPLVRLALKISYLRARISKIFSSGDSL